MNPYTAAQSIFKGVGGIKRKSKANQRRVRKLQISNRETHTGTKAAKAFTQIAGPNSDRIKRLTNSGLTSSSGLGFDGLGLHATTSGHLYLTAVCGTDFANATVAMGSLKNVELSVLIQDASSGDRITHTGFISTLGTGSSKSYYMEFPTRTSNLANGDILEVKIEFTT